MEALKEKYASQEVTSDQSDVVRISGKDVEEVGFDKIKLQQANLKSLRVVVLDGMCIGSKMTGTGSEAVAAGVAEYCPSCARLDLSRNLFESWDEILAIIEQLPALSELHIDGNRLHLRNETSSESREQVFRNVKVVGLDDCLLGWQEVSLDSAPVIATSH